VLGLVVGLAVLPVLVGFGLAPGPVVQVAGGLGSLVAVVGGVKLTAVIWGLVARSAASPGPRVAAPSIDWALGSEGRHGLCGRGGDSCAQPAVCRHPGDLSPPDPGDDRLRRRPAPLLPV